MRILTTIAAVTIAACQTPSRPRSPVRLAVGTGVSDTVVVNSRRPTSLPVQAVDAVGRAILGAGVRFDAAPGTALTVSPTGAVTCTRAGDLAVRASLAHLSTTVFVRCRPVEYVRIPGPLQFVLGDSALGQPRDLPLAAYSADGRSVQLLAGTVGIADSRVASLARLTMTPHSPGATLAWAVIGDREARIGVHVYQRVHALEALDTLARITAERRLVAVALRLGPGELRRQHLPRGGWMLSMLPEERNDDDGLRLRVERANCQPVMTPRRFACDARDDATVIVYRPFATRARPSAAGTLLVRWLAGQ